MDRNFRTATLEGTAASRPSEAWLFAQALFGKSVPSRSRERTEARVNREHLEWLAKISPEHESQLRGLLREQADARAEREQLEGLAKISPRHESHLRRLLTSEAEAREAQGRFERLVEGWNVQEAQWDPSKHPRRGGPPNAGWFATTGGVGSAGGSTGKLDVSGRDGERDTNGQHGVPPRMLELAGAWWQTKDKLEQSRGDIERLPSRIAKERAQLGSGGRYAYIHTQNLAKAKQDLATAKAQVPQVEAQLRDLKQEYKKSGYDDVEYATWTPGETIVGGRGIERVGRAVHMGGSPAGVKPTGIEFDLALGAASLRQLGKAALKKALIKTPSRLSKPSVTDPKLHNVTEDLFKGAKTRNPIGSGSTADAIRNELRTGRATYRRFHSQKGQEYARALEKWLQKNPNASAADRAAAQQMLDDLRSALEGN